VESLGGSENATIHALLIRAAEQLARISFYYYQNKIKAQYNN